MRAVLDAGQHDGIVEEFLFEEAADGKGFTFAIKRTSEVGSVLDQNQKVRNNHDGYSPTRNMRRVAAIPNGIIHEWIQKYGVDPTAKGNEKLLWRLLDSNEYQHLRTDGKSSRIYVTPSRYAVVQHKPQPLVIA